MGTQRHCVESCSFWLATTQAFPLVGCTWKKRPTPDLSRTHTLSTSILLVSLCTIQQSRHGGFKIMAVQPLSAVLSEDQARERCAGCFNAIRGQQDGGRGSRCSGCKSIWYCSRRCQKADWGQHRQECKAWTAQDTGKLL